MKTFTPIQHTPYSTFPQRNEGVAAVLRGANKVESDKENAPVLARPWSAFEKVRLMKLYIQLSTFSVKKIVAHGSCLPLLSGSYPRRQERQVVATLDGTRS